MKDYKETLLMPKTDFPMRAGLSEKEPAILKVWNEQKLYEKILEKNKSGKPFIIHDGPPFANGDIHVGHALNKILKDFIFRYKSLKGYYSPFVWGWDTHGLPIESALIKKKGIKRKELSPASFREECYSYALTEVEKQKQGFIRLGVMGAYNPPYITLTKDYVSNQLLAFSKLVERGLIYKGLKPILWSPSSESALAQAEIVYKDKEDISIYLLLKVKDQNYSLLVWTTTPWTLPANLAVSINDKFTYVVVSDGTEKFIVVKDLVEELSKKFQKKLKVLSEVKNSDLLDAKYFHPVFGDKLCPVIAGDHVTIDTGTGLVHTAPGHGEDDFIVGKKYGLPAFCPVDERGFLNSDSGKYNGLFYSDANEKIIEDLELNKSLYHKEKIVHSYPHDWRTEKPVIFRATTQWFCSIEKLKPTLLKEIDNVVWHPNWGKERLENMIREREDWCISRQRLWGVPIPVFYAENGEAILDHKIIEEVAKKVKEEGETIWWSKDSSYFLPKNFKHPGSPNGIFTKETDIMDVWFDSGTSFSYVKNLLDYFPFDLYLEGSDQYRGWFNSSLIISTALFNKAPYKNVLSHGFILDGEGNKMSKSKGNAIEPNKVVNSIGADVLRLWVASVDYQQDCRISDELLKIEGENYRKIRNTLRFLLGNLNGFTKKDYVKPKKRFLSDQFVYLKLRNLVSEVDKCYENFLFSDAVREIKKFINSFLSNYYLDYIKDILYIDEEKSPERLSVLSTLYDLLTSLLVLLNPVIPFTTEEAYKYLTEEKEEFVILKSFPKFETLDDEETLLFNYEWFLSLREEILKELELKRSEGLLTKSITSDVYLNLEEEEWMRLNNLKYDFTKLLIVSRVLILRDKQKRIEIKKREGKTCERCWQVVDKLTDGVCERCYKILKKGNK